MVGLTLTLKRGSLTLADMATAKQKRQERTESHTRPATATAVPTPAPLKELFRQRDATKPGSKEEDQAVDRIMEAMFPNSNGTR